jgi:hypothetical protein
MTTIVSLFSWGGGGGGVIGNTNMGLCIFMGVSPLHSWLVEGVYCILVKSDYPINLVLGGWI